MKEDKLFVPNLGDLAEIQRASFYRFLVKGIGQELQQISNPFLGKAKRLGKNRRKLVLVYLYYHQVKFRGPNASIQVCRSQNSSYTIQVYVPGQYRVEVQKPVSPNFFQETLARPLLEKAFRKKMRSIRFHQDIFLAEMPLMTDEGTFLVNGCERIVISQIIRSPGIYFRKEFGKSSKKTKYTATIISNKGLWTKFFLDNEVIDEGKQDRVYVKLSEFKRKRTLSPIERKIHKLEEIGDESRLLVFDFLKYFGFTFQEIIDTVKYPQFFPTQQLAPQTLLEREFKPHEKVKVRRYTVHEYERDDWETVRLIENLFANRRSGCFSLGEIGRYKVNQSLQLHLPKQVTYLTAHDFIGILNGLIELKYFDRPNDDIDDIRNKLVRSVGELLQLQLRIGIVKLKQKLGQGRRYPAGKVEGPKTVREEELREEFADIPEMGNNDWLLDPRPVTSILRDFFKTSQLSQYMDQINPLAEITHKRRISVFGPNGLKRDHVSIVIRDIHPSQYGRLCPIETPEGQNAGLINTLALYGRVDALGSLETPYFLLENGKIASTKQPIFLNPHQEFQTRVAFGDVSTSESKILEKPYLSVKENYFFSQQKTADIPFLTLSPLQIVSVATALIPFLEHNDANRALMGSNMQRQAVPLLYPQKPIVGTGFEAVIPLDSGFVIKTYCQGEVFTSSARRIQIKDKADQIITYRLRKYSRSNQETAINQRPVVWPGEKVYSNQIIADGPSTVDGELSLGHNLVIAYMPWEGYNYEDAIVINERVLVEDCLTSVHIEKYDTNLTGCLIGNEKLTKNLPYLTKYIRRNLDRDGIVRIGSYVKEQDILIGKAIQCPEELTPERRLLKALYPDIVKVTKHYRDTSLKAKKGTHGRVIDIRIFSSFHRTQEDPSLYTTSGEMIRISIAQVRKLQVGDKLAGRHGNKGIVSRILSRQDMPYLPDGTPVDILFNPLGVPSRMNVGQIFECLLGLAGDRLGKRFKITPFDEIYGKEASRVLVNQKLKEACIQSKTEWLFDSIHPGKILLRDGRTGEYFDNPVTVGKSYILKLIHLVEDKIHARATGPYAMVTEQPLAGKAQRGGQRFGEMEVWALEAFGCSHTLQEILTIKSDDIDGRNDIYEAILSREEIEKPTPGIPEAFLTLVRELNALGMDFTLKQGKEVGHTYEKDIFKMIESRLRLRQLLQRLKIEQAANQFEEEPDAKYTLKKEQLQRKVKEIWEEEKILPLSSE